MNRGDCSAVRTIRRERVRVAWHRMFFFSSSFLGVDVERVNHHRTDLGVDVLISSSYA